ncbi:MAG: DUF2862 domain-containing protein [Pseudanabaenaceae cyanobacterium bins.68]|nr:DUF2862 domain-containing protein [Pseudanabaenaceae cyanobacterium bins.68]
MQVGQKVRVKTFRDSVGSEISQRKGEVGVIKSFKILDGKKMGFVVGFSDQQSTWFFADELETVV